MRKQLFVIDSRCIVEPADLQPHLEEHLLYMIELERQGILFASGPFSDEAGTSAGDGMTIVRADSFEAARAIAEGDPFFKHGLRTFTIRRWTVVEGRINISIELSDRTGTLG